MSGPDVKCEWNCQHCSTPREVVIFLGKLANWVAEAAKVTSYSSGYLVFYPYVPRVVTNEPKKVLEV
jgi:hypothetical protein